MQSEQPEFTNLLIVIGASAGGLAPINDILSRLPESFQATILVATHRDAQQEQNHLAKILASHTALNVAEPLEGESLQCATLYVGHPAHAIEVEGRSINLQAIKENVQRMKRIDDLFCSAAESARENTVGVILSGMLWDGVRGLQLIHDVGGKCVVQNPFDASFEDMPRNALENVPVDFVGSSAEIAEALISLAAQRECH